MPHQDLHHDCDPAEELLQRLGGEIARRQASVPLGGGGAMALRARLAAADKAPAGSAIRGGWLKSVIESWREKVGGLAAPRFAMAGAFALAVAMAAFALRGVQPAPGELSFRVGVLAMAPADGVLRAGSLVATREDAGAVLELGERLKGERRIQLLLAENSEIAVLSAERVELRRGAVWASVVPNSGPFAIATPRGEVAVVGTQFGVEATDDGLALGVARGKVQLSAPSGSPMAVSAGERSGIDAEGAFRPVTAEAEVTLPAWAREIQLAALKDRVRYFPSARQIGDHPK